MYKVKNRPLLLIKLEHRHGAERLDTDNISVSIGNDMDIGIKQRETFTPE